jgi:hypothetical protein
MVLLIALQLWLLGRSLGGSRATGPLAVILFMVVGDLNLDPSRPGAFKTDVFNVLPGSPTYALGIAFFLGLLLLVQSRLIGDVTAASPSRNPMVGSLQAGTVGALVMVGLLVLGAGATKMYALADFTGGLGVYWLWRVATGTVERLLSLCLAVTLICAGVIYRLTLTGGGAAASTMGIHPLNFVQYTIFSQVLTVNPILRIPLVIGVVVVIFICGCAPLVGVAWLLAQRARTLPFATFSAAVFGVSIAAYLIFGAPDGPVIYFFNYGYLAAVPFSALGLVTLWNGMPRPVRGRAALACGATLAFGLSVAGTTRILSALGVLSGTSRSAWYAWYAAAYGLVGGAVVLAILWVGRDRTWNVPSHATRVLACGIPLLLALGLVEPLATTAPGLLGAVFRRPVGTPDSALNPGLTSPLYKGLMWVREHTNRCDVLAVNSHYREGSVDSDYLYYSAFTERRVFLESWLVTPAGLNGGQPFPGRFALNSMATLHGSPAALRELARLGVRYVLIDKTHEGRVQEPASASRLVFRNSALDVYRLPAPAGSDTASGTCGQLSRRG